jgi:hypothetical protein
MNPVQQIPSVPTNAQDTAPQSTCIWSILSLIFAFLIFPLGLIFGIIALIKIGKNTLQKGKGLAIAGIIISVIIGPLLLLIMIGAIAYFGVLNPQTFLPERCGFGTTMYCTQYSTVEKNGVLTQDIVIRNAMGTDIVLLPAQSSCRLTSDGIEGTLSISTTELAEGETTQITCTLSTAEYRSGDHVKAAYIISYYPKSMGQQSQKQLTGEAYTVVR